MIYCEGGELRAQMLFERLAAQANAPAPGAAPAGTKPALVRPHSAAPVAKRTPAVAQTQPQLLVSNGASAAASPQRAAANNNSQPRPQTTGASGLLTSPSTALYF